MSGPWDRPSSPSPDDQDWPAEDLESSRPRDPWSSDDPWQESTRDSSPGWDVWPPPAPAPDEYVIEEPERPSSDPWAESWDDVPDMPFAAEGPLAEAPAPTDAPAPRIAPWAPEPDPWGAATIEPWRPAEPWRDEPEQPGDALGGDAPGDAPPAELSATAGPATQEPAVEPRSEPDRPVQLAPEPTLEPEREQHIEPEPERFVEPESERVVEPEPAPVTDSFAALEPKPLVEHAPEPFAEPEPEVDSGARPALEAEPEPEPPPTAPGDSAEPPAVPVEPAPEPTPEEWATVDEHARGPGARSWEADLWATEPEPEPDAEPQREPQPEPEAVAEPEPEAAPERNWQPQPWSGESTQVLPPGWKAPSPTRDEPEPLTAEAGRIRTSLAGPEPSAEEDELAERPSTAEQAVPWLIGVILLLAGMVIVLLALIFAGDASLGGSAVEPSPSAAGFVATASSATPVPTPSTPRPSESAAPSVTAAPTSTAPPAPEYGPLEMLYQGRSAARAPIYLLHRDFTVDAEPEILAQDANLDVRAFAWAPDGTVGAGLYADLLISVEPGKEKRNLGDGIVSLTFGNDASTVYAVRKTEDGADDVLTVLGIDYASGDTTELATVTYPRPTIEEEDVAREAQFADEGGAIRLYWMQGDMLRLWSLGAGSWEIDPSNGEVTELDGKQPVLWSPGGVHRITRTFGDGVTGIRLHEGDDEEPVSETSIEGFVSHLRWSPDGERIVFTVGRPSGGGVLQDLYLWDLEDGEAPMQITSTGAAFGAEWRGATPRWEAD